PVMLRRALVGLFAGGRATEEMTEEAAAAAEVGKAIASIGDPRPEAAAGDPQGDPQGEPRAESRMEASG
ncbi:MAG TPA: hypothetical protein VK932_22665, partial [Kofleriaceae bacterium]|nr:hypothetical protein [Kofleriaceae bacterium]